MALIAHPTPDEWIWETEQEAKDYAVFLLGHWPQTCFIQNDDRTWSTLASPI